MSHLLEVFGRGLIAHLSGAFGEMLGFKTEASAATLQAIIDADPTDVDAMIKLGGRHLRDNEPVLAREVFLRALAIDRKKLPARIGLGCAFDELNQVEISLEQMRIAQKQDPTSPAILFCLGYCHERLRNSRQAIEYYQQSLAACPTLRNAHERLAAIHLHENRIHAAIEHYERLCELDAEQIDLHLTLANLLLKAGRFEDAVSRYEHALGLEPDNWEVHNDVVSAYEEAGLIREAIEHLHKLIDAEQDQPDTRLRLGDLYARLGDDVSAMTHYSRALELSPDYLEANVKAGTQHLRAGRFRDAARRFSQALEINDRLLGAYVGIGVAHHAEGRTEEALASFEMARNIEPNSTLLFSEVARMQLKADAATSARKYLKGCGLADADSESQRPADLITRQIDRLRESISRNPNHADLHYRLGLLLKNRGQVEEAIACFRSAIEINPSYMKALIKLGLALRDVNRSGEAIEVLRRAVDVKPDYADLHYQLGLLFAQRYQFELAVEQFEQAAKWNAQNVDFQANLALALQGMGLIDRANATWQIVCELAPDSAHAAQARSAMAESKNK